MPTFFYEFEELPLVIHNGIEAALINGIVVIEYNRRGEWHTRTVSVEGFGERDANGKRQWPQIPAPTALAAIIVGRLEHEWEIRVQDAVNERIEEDHQRAVDDYADMRREQRILERD